VRAVQRTGLFISPSHHSGHHYSAGALVSRERSTIRFCVMTDWCNPVLDRLGVFRALNKI
jgi:hypothetical protein